MISSPEHRATVLARYDGFELISKIIATLLAPVLMKHIDKFVNYGLRCICTFLAIIYVILKIKEPESTLNDKPKFEFKSAVIQPIIETFRCLFKKRLNGVHYLILLQFFNGACYWFILEEKSLQYLYLLKVFDEFDAIDYSYFFLFVQCE